MTMVSFSMAFLLYKMIILSLQGMAFMIVIMLLLRIIVVILMNMTMAVMKVMAL